MHLLVAVTSHGFGHLAQVAPVVNTLLQRAPRTRVTLLSDLPEWLLRQRVRTDFALVRRAPDFGLLMNSALEIDLTASANAYADLHRRWEQQVCEEARRLRQLKPDLLLADVPYLTLAGAQRAGIPAIALCSLNWAEIYRYFFARRREAPRILAEMEAAYNSALYFLRPQPAMPMQELRNTLSIGAIAAQGTNRRATLTKLFGLDPQKKLVLVTLGGVDMRLDIDRWPGRQNIHWLVSETWGIGHADASPYERAGVPFTDLIASCDAVLGKCGYNTVTECVACGTPLMFVPRADWPEQASLLEWLDGHRGGLPVAAERLVSGRFADLVEAAGALPMRRGVFDGADQAAGLLHNLLEGGVEAARPILSSDALR